MFGWLRSLLAKPAKTLPDTREAQTALQRLAAVEQFLLDEETRMYQQQERRHDRH